MMVEHEEDDEDEEEEKETEEEARQRREDGNVWLGFASAAIAGMQLKGPQSAAQVKKIAGYSIMVADTMLDVYLQKFGDEVEEEDDEEEEEEEEDDEEDRHVRPRRYRR